MMEAFQALLLQTEKQQDEKAEARQKSLLLEAEEQQKELMLEFEGRQVEECKSETGDIKALVQEQKQMQEHTLSLIHI